MHTLLIAEDIEINREIIGAILEETKVAFDFAEDGNEAVAMFKENPEKYSLILMDVNMPGMSGYDATKAIRALNLAKAQTIPIIAMTANVFKEDIEKCIECGMNGHTGKPVNLEALLEILNKYLKVPEGA
jgi:CheY-like chemotaxis protein